MIVLLWVVALVFPKAGFYLGEVPITFASVAVMAYAAFHFLYPGYPPRLSAESRRFTRVHLVFVWVLTISLLANLGSIDTVDITTWLLLAASPLSFHAGLRVKHPQRILVVVLVATLAVGGYAVAQNLLGVTEIAVPGLTHVEGEDLIADNPIRTPSGTLKSPSTYHNGNLAAAFLLVGIGFSLVGARIDARLRWLAALATAAALAGVAVSLARAAVLGFLIAALVALLPPYRPPWLGKRIAGSLAVVFFAIACLVFGYILTGSETFLVERFITNSIDDPTGAGRTEGYSAWLNHLGEISPGEFVKVIIFGDWSIDIVADKLEGAMAMVAKFGVPTLVAFVSLLAVPCRMIRQRLGSNGTVIWFGLLASASMFLIDSTFFFPPTLMNWCLLAGLAVRLSTPDVETVIALETDAEVARQLELAS